MDKTEIPWAKNPDGSQGYTWNPITGCLNHTNGMCKGGNFPCFAYRLAHGWLRERYLANSNLAKREIYQDDENLYCIGDHDPFYPRFWGERLIQPAHGLGGYLRTKPKGIFVCDMSDLFGIGIPEDWTKRVLEQIKIFSQHRFYLLTKQPQNLNKFSPLPDNCWVGETVTNQDDSDRTFNDFAKVEATVKYLSLEPLLSKVDVSPYLKGWLNAGTTFENPEGVERYDVDGALVNHIDWLIIGALTGTFRGLLPIHLKTDTTLIKLGGNRWSLQPQIERVEEIVKAADKAGIPVFLKDNLKPILPHSWFKDKPSADWAYTRLGDLRQEMPGG